MHDKNRLLHWVSLCFLTLWASIAQAENSYDFGDYVVHYNALNTDMLSPKVAQEYGIQRSKNRGMLNIVVLRKVLGATGKPTPAKVTGTSTNLTGSRSELEFREIREPNAIYYIAEFGVTNEEILVFDIVAETDESEPMDVKFRKQFFTR